MVDAISRKPVHLLDLELEVLHRFALHIVERELALFALRQIVNGSNETPASITLEREEKQEISVFNVGVQFAMDRLPGCHHIGDIEQASVRSARKSDSKLAAND